MDLLRTLMQSPSAVTLEMLQKELEGMVRSRAELLRRLRQGEMLGFIEKKRNDDKNFLYRITPQGKRVFKKYSELLEVLGSKQKYIVKIS